LFRRGDKAVGVFLVRRGKVSLSLDGTSVISRTLGPGSLLGLPATLSGEPYSLTATVAEDCQLDFIRREAVLRPA
jgi:CRP-like cAMP-binding protein